MNVGMVKWLSHHSSPYGIEHDVAYKRLCWVLSIIVCIIRGTAKPNPYRPGNISHDDIGKAQVFNACSSGANLNWTTIRIIDQTISHCNVLRFTSAKTEYGPPGTETAISDSNKPITAKQSTGIILALYITIYNVHIFAIIEMETIIILVHPVIDSYSINVHLFAF